MHARSSHAVPRRFPYPCPSPGLAHGCRRVLLVPDLPHDVRAERRLHMHGGECAGWLAGWGWRGAQCTAGQLARTGRAPGGTCSRPRAALPAPPLLALQVSQGQFQYNRTVPLCSEYGSVAPDGSCSSSLRITLGVQASGPAAVLQPRQPALACTPPAAPRRASPAASAAPPPCRPLADWLSSCWLTVLFLAGLVLPDGGFHHRPRPAQQQQRGRARPAHPAVQGWVGGWVGGWLGLGLCQQGGARGGQRGARSMPHSAWRQSAPPCLLATRRLQPGAPRRPMASPSRQAWTAWETTLGRSRSPLAPRSWPPSATTQARLGFGAYHPPCALVLHSAGNAGGRATIRCLHRRAGLLCLLRRGAGPPPPSPHTCIVPAGACSRLRGLHLQWLAQGADQAAAGPLPRLRFALPGAVHRKGCAAFAACYAVHSAWWWGGDGPQGRHAVAAAHANAAAARAAPCWYSCATNLARLLACRRAADPAVRKPGQPALLRALRCGGRRPDAAVRGGRRRPLPGSHQREQGLWLPATLLLAYPSASCCFAQSLCHT